MHCSPDEFYQLLSQEEREFLIILQSHLQVNIPAHIVMSLRDILKKHYNNEAIEVSQIVKSIEDRQIFSTKMLMSIRKQNENESN